MNAVAVGHPDKPGPHVGGFCPKGCGETLFLGAGGRVTCANVSCPAPLAVDRNLSVRPGGEVVAPYDDVRVGGSGGTVTVGSGGGGRGGGGSRTGGSFPGGAGGAHVSLELQAAPRSDDYITGHRTGFVAAYPLGASEGRMQGYEDAKYRAYAALEATIAAERLLDGTVASFTKRLREVFVELLGKQGQ